MSAADADAASARTRDSELCILGAGICGLNALFVATRYLKKTDRVVLVDRFERCGGMWTRTYDYVRLHQPHPMFTVGNIKWRLDRPRDHLATRDEVLDYFAHAVDQLRGRVDLVELYGHELVAVEETDGGAIVRARCLRTGADVEIRTARCIKAFGGNVPRLEPLPVSSEAVISTTPERLFDANGPAAGATGPVYVIGGGKTGMDTAQALLARHPGRPVTMLVGSGTVFLARETLFPKGLRRWYGGRMTLPAFGHVAATFDGTNETEIFDDFYNVYGISLEAGYRQHFFGILSGEENDALRAGLSGIVRDRFVDAVDGPDGPMLVLKGGGALPVPPGSVIVNCTGYLQRGDTPDEPCLSPGGAILSVNLSNAIHILSSVSAFFLAHLFFRGRLRGMPLYVINLEEAVRRNRMIYQFAGMTVTFHNTLLIMRAVPLRLLLECGLDLDLWYPAPRRAAALVAVQWNMASRVARCRRTLEAVRARFGNLCAPLAA